MGTSTNAYLFFGFSFCEEDGGEDRPDWMTPPEDDEGDFDHDWERTYAERKDGIKPPAAEYSEATKPEFEAYWDAKRASVDQAPCEIDFHCSHECPIWYVALSGANFCAYRGSETEIQLPNIHEEQIAEMRAFCELMGITWQEPKWRLVSYWG